jgi:hypothetical protein
VIKNRRLADEVEQIRRASDDGAEPSREKVRAAIAKYYTAPA